MNFPRETYSTQEEGWATNPLTHLTRTVISFLQGLFEQAPAGTYRWSRSDTPNQEGSEIFISADHPLNVNLVGKRPAITVLRSAAQFQGVGLGDLAYVDWRNNAKVKMDVIPVSVSINCLSRLPFEAESLAWVVANHIWALRELLQVQKGILFIGNRPSISPPLPPGQLVSPDTEHNWTACAVGFSVYLQHSTTTVPLGQPILEGVQVVTTTLPQSGSSSSESTE